jgi:ABC-2 type transport system ATP-binding protein
MAILAVEVRDLRKRFRKRRSVRKTSPSAEWALAGVSFHVAAGETYGVLGPNGSGTSTLIRILWTLLIADGGEVRLLGHRLPDERAQVRRLIGRVSVDAAFYKKLSARENLLYTALLYGLPPSAASGRRCRSWSSSEWRSTRSPSRSRR